MSDKNGKDFNFDEASYEEFLERFQTVEQRVAYLEELDRKMEFTRKQDAIERRKSNEESRKRFEQIEKNLAHITQLTGIVFDELEFQDEKLDEAGKVLSRKRKK